MSSVLHFFVLYWLKISIPINHLCNYSLIKRAFGKVLFYLREGFLVIVLVRASQDGDVSPSVLHFGAWIKPMGIIALIVGLSYPQWLVITLGHLYTVVSLSLNITRSKQRGTFLSQKSQISKFKP